MFKLWLSPVVERHNSGAPPSSDPRVYIGGRPAQTSSDIINCRPRCGAASASSASAALSTSEAEIEFSTILSALSGLPCAANTDTPGSATRYHSSRGLRPWTPDSHLGGQTLGAYFSLGIRAPYITAEGVAVRLWCVCLMEVAVVGRGWGVRRGAGGTGRWGEGVDG